jgi:hypothetical protein
MACKGIKEAEDAMAREVERCSGSKSESGRAGLSALQIQSCMYQAVGGGGGLMPQKRHVPPSRRAQASGATALCSRSCPRCVHAACMPLVSTSYFELYSA